ncbi:MAG: NADH-quinone oxidoreductase subunit C [Dehalococcoidia bacterium]|nr:NADH-quinone oxidoreductase subunit C [Dehalococcoidia bacterium]
MTTTLSGHDIAEKLRAALPDAVEEEREEWVVVSPESIADVCRLLRDDDETDFRMLRSIDAVDFIDRFELRYGLLSIHRNQEATLKVRVWGRDELSVRSVTPVWEGANLQEREIYDLFGIEFDGHPNMKRILLWEGFPGHPLRKDFA